MFEYIQLMYEMYPLLTVVVGIIIFILLFKYIKGFFIAGIIILALLFFIPYAINAKKETDKLNDKAEKICEDKEIVVKDINKEYMTFKCKGVLKYYKVKNDKTD